jgi:spermidine synthase
MLHFREEIYPYAQQSMTVDELLYAGRSAYQDVLLFRNQFYGTVLVLDDVVQHAFCGLSQRGV